MNRLLILLVMVGWALYVVHAHSTDGKDVQAQNSQAAVAERLTVEPPAVPSEKSKLQPIASAAKQSPHAITPDEMPRQEPANSSASPPQIPTTENTKPPLEVNQKEVGSHQLEEQLRVTRETSIRSGPSDTAQLIGRAHRGATLQAKSREAGWVQFVDPVANETGWISMAYLQPSDALGDVSEPPKRATTRTPKPTSKVGKLNTPIYPKPAPVMRRAPSSYAQLPADREFVPPKRGGLFGLFWRRRFSADYGG